MAEFGGGNPTEVPYNNALQPTNNRYAAEGRRYTRQSTLTHSSSCRLPLNRSTLSRTTASAACLVLITSILA